MPDNQEKNDNVAVVSEQDFDPKKHEERLAQLDQFSRTSKEKKGRLNTELLYVVVKEGAQGQGKGAGTAAFRELVKEHRDEGRTGYIKLEASTRVGARDNSPQLFYLFMGMIPCYWDPRIDDFIPYSKDYLQTQYIPELIQIFKESLSNKGKTINLNRMRERYFMMSVEGFNKWHSTIDRSKEFTAFKDLSHLPFTPQQRAEFDKILAARARGDTNIGEIPEIVNGEATTVYDTEEAQRNKRLEIEGAYETFTGDMTRENFLKVATLYDKYENISPRLEQVKKFSYASAQKSFKSLIFEAIAKNDAEVLAALNKTSISFGEMVQENDIRKFITDRNVVCLLKLREWGFNEDSLKLGAHQESVLLHIISTGNENFICDYLRAYKENNSPEDFKKLLESHVASGENKYSILAYLIHIDMKQVANLIVDLSLENGASIDTDVLPILVQKNDVEVIGKLLEHGESSVNDVVNKYLPVCKSGYRNKAVEKSLRQFMNRNDFTVDDTFLQKMAKSNDTFLLYETLKHATKDQLEQFFKYKGINGDEQKKIWVKTFKDRFVGELEAELRSVTKEQGRDLLNNTLGLEGIHGEKELKSNNNALVAVFATHTGRGFSFNVQTSKGTKLFSQSTKTIEAVLDARDSLDKAAASKASKPS